MDGKEIAKELGTAALKSLAESAPKIIEKISKKKEEKSFFEENKNWIFMIILSIFVIKLDYINMFESVVLNSIINIIFGIIVFILLGLFYYEEKDSFGINSRFIRTLLVLLIVLGFINSFYHISYAIINLII